MPYIRKSCSEPNRLNWRTFGKIGKDWSLNKRINDQQKFLPFYFVAQAVFYIIIFRQDKIGTVELQSLNLQAIVFSKLNPLAEMVPAIAAKFADIMKETEILFCHGVLEQVLWIRINIFKLKLSRQEEND